MSDSGHPESGATRGASAGWERCIDCVPFQSLATRVEKLEGCVEDVRRHQIEQTLQINATHTAVEAMKSDVRRVIGWLDGKNGDSGFRVDWTRFQSQIEANVAQIRSQFNMLDHRTGASKKFKERVFESVIVAVLVAALLGVGALIINAVNTGTLPAP